MTIARSSSNSPASRAAHRPSRRQEILSAAVPVFSENGPRATIASIGARCGVHVSAIYYHFSGKDQLFSEVVESIAARIEAATVAAETQAGATMPMAAAVETAWRWSEQHRDEARILYSWAGSGPVAARRARQRFIERYRDRVISRIPRRSRSKPIDDLVDRLAVRTYMNMAMGLSQSWVVGETIGGTSDRERIVAALTSVSRRLTGAP
jgi:AcrR family transcriptional regulator